VSISFPAGRYQLIPISLQDFHAGCDNIQAATIALVFANQSVDEVVQVVILLTVFHCLGDVFALATTSILVTPVIQAI